MIISNPVIETARLKLSLLTERDREDIFRLVSDPEVMRFFPAPLDRTGADIFLQKILAMYNDKGSSFLKVCLAENGSFTGIAGLLPQVFDGADELEIGYRFLPACWHRGYATEAAAALLEYARGIMGRSRVVSIIRPENTPSQGVARRLGAAVEKQIIYYGYVHDLWVYP